MSCCKVLYHFLYLEEQILHKSCWEDHYYMSSLMSQMNKVSRWIVLTIKCRLGFAEEKVFMIYVSMILALHKSYSHKWVYFKWGCSQKLNRSSAMELNDPGSRCNSKLNVDTWLVQFRIELGRNTGIFLKTWSVFPIKTLLYNTGTFATFKVGLRLFCFICNINKK